MEKTLSMETTQLAPENKNSIAMDFDISTNTDNLLTDDDESRAPLIKKVQNEETRVNKPKKKRGKSRSRYDHVTSKLYDTTAAYRRRKQSVHDSGCNSGIICDKNKAFIKSSPKAANEKAEKVNVRVKSSSESPIRRSRNSHSVIKTPERSPPPMGSKDNKQISSPYKSSPTNNTKRRVVKKKKKTYPEVAMVQKPSSSTLDISPGEVERLAENFLMCQKRLQENPRGAGDVYQMPSFFVLLPKNSSPPSAGREGKSEENIHQTTCIERNKDIEENFHNKCNKVEKEEGDTHIDLKEDNQSSEVCDQKQNLSVKTTFTKEVPPSMEDSPTTSTCSDVLSPKILMAYEKLQELYAQLDSIITTEKPNTETDNMNIKEESETNEPSESIRNKVNTNVTEEPETNIVREEPAADEIQHRTDHTLPINSSSKNLNITACTYSPTSKPNSYVIEPLTPEEESYFKSSFTCCDFHFMGKELKQSTTFDMEMNGEENIEILYGSDHFTFIVTGSEGLISDTLPRNTDQYATTTESDNSASNDESHDSTSKHDSQNNIIESLNRILSNQPEQRGEVESIRSLVDTTREQHHDKKSNDTPTVSDNLENNVNNLEEVSEVTECESGTDMGVETYSEDTFVPSESNVGGSSDSDLSMETEISSDKQQECNQALTQLETVTNEARNILRSNTNNNTQQTENDSHQDSHIMRSKAPPSFHTQDDFMVDNTKENNYPDSPRPNNTSSSQPTALALSEQNSNRSTPEVVMANEMKTKEMSPRHSRNSSSSSIEEVKEETSSHEITFQDLIENGTDFMKNCPKEAKAKEARIKKEIEYALEKGDINRMVVLCDFYREESKAARFYIGILMMEKEDALNKLSEAEEELEEKELLKKRILFQNSKLKQQNQRLKRNIKLKHGENAVDSSYNDSKVIDALRRQLKDERSKRLAYEVEMSKNNNNANRQ